MTVAIDNRSVRREAVLPKSNTLESARSKVDQDDATRKTYLFSTYHCVDTRLDSLHDLFRVFPKLEQTYWDSIRTANLENGIKDTEFQFKKERILIIYHLLKNIKRPNKGEIRNLADAVLNCRDTDAVRVLKRLKVAAKEDKSSTSGGYINAAKRLVKGTLALAKSSNLTTEKALWRDANDFASSVPDTHFLLGLKTTPADECLRDAVVEAEEMAYTYLRKLIESLVDRISPQIFSNQKAEGDKQVQREVASDEDKELEILRSEFVHHVEDLSRERSRSYVHCSLA